MPVAFDCVQKAVDAEAAEQIGRYGIRRLEKPPVDQGSSLGVFVEDHGDKDDGELEIIVRQPLEDVVVAAESLEHDGHAAE